MACGTSTHTHQLPPISYKLKCGRFVQFLVLLQFFCSTLFEQVQPWHAARRRGREQGELIPTSSKLRLCSCSCLVSLAGLSLSLPFSCPPSPTVFDFFGCFLFFFAWIAATRLFGAFPFALIPILLQNLSASKYWTIRWRLAREQALEIHLRGVKIGVRICSFGLQESQ